MTVLAIDDCSLRAIGKGNLIAILDRLDRLDKQLVLVGIHDGLHGRKALFKRIDRVPHLRVVILLATTDRAEQQHGRKKHT